ncbi:Zn-ribbon domain-containing OB-fold protein [Brucella cytisi]|uniref:Zn-ribbon domain-containing OB-fold protein n=1 Tax=Brucella cytisi TaxID=407152 RepID=UPI001694E3C6|nr:hypothetical protein [Brucella cytisi]
MTHAVSAISSPNEMQGAGVGQKSFQLQRCVECLAFQYPARDACVNCLSSKLEWTETSDRGTILAQTVIHVSNEQYFKSKLPQSICITKLDCGPNIVCFVSGKIKAGERVIILTEKGYNGGDVYVAVLR